MSPFSCAREQEVTELLHQGYWPDACPAELRGHVEACRICSDLVVVAQAFQQAHMQDNACAADGVGRGNLVACAVAAAECGD